MRTLTVLFTLTILFSISSCQKWNKEKASVYYSTDFKAGEGSVMDVDVKDIDYLYTAFFYEGKVLKYKLFAERATLDQKTKSWPIRREMQLLMKARLKYNSSLIQENLSLVSSKMKRNCSKQQSPDWSCVN